VALRDRSDRHALSVVEAAYGMADGSEAWLEAVIVAARPLLDRGHGMFGFIYEVDSGGRLVATSAPIPTANLPPGIAEGGMRTAESLPTSIVRQAFVFGSAIATASALWTELAAHAHPSQRPLDSLVAVGFADSIGVTAYDPGGRGVLLSSVIDAPSAIDPCEFRRWERLRSHLLTGLRLRTALKDEAVLEPSGRVVHAEGEARRSGARDALRRQALHIDRSRSAPGRRDPAGALQEWRALVEGRWSLVDRFESDGRRYLVARRNDLALAGLRSLSRSERQVAAFAALGYANKQIAYTLGLAPSTVSSHLRAAMLRLGVTTRAALSELWSLANARGTQGSP
jgi:DNA-binding CsgD family transcriptional regulator